MDLEQILALFFEYFGITSSDIRMLYLLKIRTLNPAIAIQRLNSLINTWEPNYGRKAPSIAEILSGTEAEIENKWQLFQKHAFQQFEQIPTEIYTIKKLIGLRVIDNCLEDNISRIRKEFIYWHRALEAGEVEKQEDPRNGRFISAEGEHIIPAKTRARSNDPVRIKELLSIDQIGGKLTD